MFFSHSGTIILALHYSVIMWTFVVHFIMPDPGAGVTGTGRLGCYVDRVAEFFLLFDVGCKKLFIHVPEYFETIKKPKLNDTILGCIVLCHVCHVF